MRFLSRINTPLQLNRGWRILAGIAIAAVLLLLYRTPLQLQLWNDEVFSLIHFQLVSPLKTVTWYPETNNHVLFNLLQNLWIRLIGNPGLQDLLLQPQLLRIPLLIYAWITCLTLFFGCQKRFGPTTAVLAVTLLLTSIPYYNFALQGRAYGLLIMTATLQLFSFLDYLESGGRRRLWIQAIWAFLLFYAQPAGLYLGIAWIVAAVLCFSGDLRRPSLMRQRAFYSCCAWICGLFLAGIAYLPIMTQILQNPWVGLKRVTYDAFFRDTFVSVLRQLIGGQWWVPALLLAGTFATGMLKRAPLERRIALYCIAVTFCCYLMPLVRLDEAPQRTFTMLIPYIVVAMAAACAGIQRSLPEKWRVLPALAVITGLALRFPVLLTQRDQRIETAIREGTELSSIETAYYLHRFNPLEITLKAKVAASRNQLAVYSAIAYRQELPHYLEAFGLQWLEYRSPQQRAELPAKALIITSLLPEFRRRYNAELRHQVLDSTGGFYEILAVERRQFADGSTRNP